MYAIADSAWNPYATLPRLVQDFLAGGCRFVQLRMKDAPAHAVRSVAMAITALKRTQDFTFIVNDHPEVAVAVGADGVHVGSNDMPLSDVRGIVGPEMLVGYSSHAIEEAQRAATSGADYVAFGAIFPTRTKGPGHPVQGLDRLRALVAAVDKPVVAIGGIDRTNVRDVIDAGASSIAMITGLSQAADVVEETRWYADQFEA